jgi:S1-C subfamily serine protease
MQLGDAIQAVDGEPVRTMPDLLNRIARKRPGSVVQVVGLRGDEQRAWRVELGERPTDSWR